LVYEGRTSRSNTDGSRGDHGINDVTMSVVEFPKEILIAKCDQQFTVHQLIPDAVYTFAISAKFGDDDYGDPATQWLNLAATSKASVQGK
jgi:hypothetical protein